MAKKILIVEDQIVTAMDLMELMADWGYDFAPPAVSGEEAVRRAGEEKPDLVLMDVSLAFEMSGVEAAREICARYNIPFIFISAYLEEDLAEKIEMPCRYIYLTKPYDLEQLKGAIETILKVKIPPVK